MAFTNQLDALAALKQLPAVRGRATAEDDAFLNGLLLASAGTVPAAGAAEGGTSYAAGTTIFRHYYTAAKFLEELPSLHSLSKAAGGVEFTGFKVPIASLYALQAAQDEALALAVPPGYEAIAEVECVAPSGRYGLLLGSGASKITVLP